MTIDEADKLTVIMKKLKTLELCGACVTEGQERNCIYHDVQELVEELELLHNPEKLTCYDCDARCICEFAGDPYNTDGDCLAMK